MNSFGGIVAFSQSQQKLSYSSLNSSGFSLLNSSLLSQLPEEVQSAVNQNWEEWKSIMTLPLDLNSTDDEEEDGEDRENERKRASATEKLPKFVLIEIDGVRLFYPSCLVGIVAQELNEPNLLLQREREQRVLPEDLDLTDSLVGFSEDSQLDLLEIRRQKALAAKKRENFGGFFGKE